LAVSIEDLGRQTQRACRTTSRFRASASPNDATDVPKLTEKKKRTPIDPDMIGQTEQKMKDQGMLEDNDEDEGGRMKQLHDDSDAKLTAIGTGLKRF